VKDSYYFVNAICPFDPYGKSKKAPYLALMGATAPGQSKTCGNPSKDVKGTISGIWHLSRKQTRETFMGAYDGNYPTPFSLYRDSAGQIVIYELDKQRYIVGSENSTYKNPAKVKTKHCYNLTQYPGETPNGYAYFRVVSDMEMKVAYSGTGTCPATFPRDKAKTYYR
jgi:hypothetical protein